MRAWWIGAALLALFTNGAVAQDKTPALPAGALCAERGTIAADALTRPHWNGWGVDADQHRFQSADMARLAAADVPKLKLKWAFGIPGVARTFAQPTIVGNHLFFGSPTGTVYALDARSGCLYWTFAARVGVRSAIVLGHDGRGWTAYFGDLRGYAYAVDAVTGVLRWRVHLDEHPSAGITDGPTLDGGKLYIGTSSGEEGIGANPGYSCCSVRGSVSAIDAATGKILWKSYTIAEEARPVRRNAAGIELMGPSGAGIWSSPTVDAALRRLYVTTGDNYSDPPSTTSDAFMALDIATGKPVWTRQMTGGDAYNIGCEYPKHTNCPTAKGPDVDFASPAILVELGGGKRALIAGQKSGVVTALDPDHDGAILWQHRIGKGSALGGVQWGMAADRENVYAALSDIDSHVVKQGTPGSHRVGELYFLLDDKAGGGLFALKLATGEVAWSTPHPGCAKVPGCSPAQSAAITAIPGIVFSGGVDGHLRAYATQNGHIVWDIDTKGSRATVNGVAAHGGSINGPGPVVVDGILYVNSGYASYGQAGGNLLMAYSVDGK